MSMASLQLYRNKYSYPDYSPSIQSYGAAMDCTPVGVGLREGSLRVVGDMSDFMNCNYLAITRDNQTIYGWIEDIQHHTANSFLVTYRVDPWRTYQNNIDLAVQFIRRSPQETKLLDDMLGSLIPRPSVRSDPFIIGSATQRTFVVQTRIYSGELYFRTPVQPTPYGFYMINYSINNWTDTQALDELMTAIGEGAEPENIVTMYSIPYVNLSTLPTADLNVYSGSDQITISGFHVFSTPAMPQVDPATILYNETDIVWPAGTDDIYKTDHAMQIVVPEGGIIDIPAELIGNSSLKLRQDIDLFSGAANYMLKSGNDTYYRSSVRGSSVNSIPIVSDPMDTYLTQNQNALTTAMIGDVATMGGGVAMAAMGGPAGMMSGGMMAARSGVNIASRYANAQDASSRFSNPPAFLGSALAANFNGTFWLVTVKKFVSNETEVHDNFGYPFDMVAELEFPNNGYIQTEGCSVQTTNGSVPRWAIQEINQLFDQGIKVHPN